MMQQFGRSLARTLARLTLDSNIPLDTIADDHRRTSRRASETDIFQVDIGTDRIGGTGQICNHLALLP